MTDKKITQLTALTGANAVAGDQLAIVDVSDTTMSASGTTKKIALSELQAAPLSAGTANGVAYLNGSKVLTTGSALTFNGATLTVKGGNAGQLVLDNGNEQFVQQVFRRNATGNTGLDFLLDGTANTFAFRGLAANLPFIWSLSTAAGNPVEQMRLTSTGLGIGTSAPASKLVVSNAGALGIEFDPASGGMQVYNRSTSAYGTMNLYANTLYFRTGTSPAINMTLDASGNVGIGTTSPGSKLDVTVTSATAYSAGVLGNGLRLYNNSLTTGQYVGISFFGEPTSGSFGGATIMGTTTGNGSMALAFSTRNNSVFDERLRITSAGNVGIGTSSPAVSGLEISRATGSASPTPAELRLSTTNSAADWSTTDPWGRLSFYSADVSSTGPKIVSAIDVTAAAATGGTGSLSFKLAALTTGTLTERMRIDTVGNVGIGTSSPVAVLTSENSGALTLDSNDGDHSGFGLFITRSSLTTDTVNSAIGFGPTSGRKYAAIGMQTYSDVDQNGLNFYVQKTPTGSSAQLSEAMRIDSAGNLLVGLTSATGVALLQVSGPIQTTGYTVATLPAGTVGMRTYVTDALAPAFGVAVAGSGAVTIPVFYDGANWIVA
jgi:hypothetical protein